MVYTYGVGAALTCLGSALGLDWLSSKTVTPQSNKEDAVVYAVASGAAIATLETVRSYVEHSSPFWKGMSDCIPVTCLLVGQLFGTSTVSNRTIVVEQKPELIESQEYKNSLNYSWSANALLGFSGLILTTDAVIPREYANVIAVACGIFLGVSRAEDALQKARGH